MAMGTYLPPVAQWNNEGLLGIPTLQYSNMAMENVIFLLKPQFRVDVQLPRLSFFSHRLLRSSRLITGG